ncbi:hypothetical protein [Nocardia salmonicida]|uniref:hypothetical protein n=1 Tax=Nocardia salmonicida TaxID=53431 RepID=UPI00378BEA57
MTTTRQKIRHRFEADPRTPARSPGSLEVNSAFDLSGVCRRPLTALHHAAFTAMRSHSGLPTIQMKGVMMRIANYTERATLLAGTRGDVRPVDIATASDGRFGPDLSALYRDWTDFTKWAAIAGIADEGDLVDRGLMTPPPSFLEPDGLATLMTGAHSIHH